MSRDPIAIIGIGCRFPGGAHGPQAFWRLLTAGVDAIREVPADRWSIDGYFDPTPGRAGKSITRWGGFVDDIDKFDPGFFGISPREAEFMDPQQRLLLETAWEALEDAGQTAAALRGSPTGVFVGISTHDYELLQTSPDERGEIDIYSTTGGVLSIAANRLSYCFDLRGPSLAIDTACSSSLFAMHMACTSLRSGDCSLALVGGVNALLAPMPFIAFSRMSMLSPTGRCRAFDAAADGFVRGEGAGVVVLKPLARALADHDPVYAVIRATAVNQDGRTNGITVPSAEAQGALVRAACRAAGVAPASIGYVEAHGTGTPVGDPIEAHALGEALGEDRRADHPCVVGSVKTNIGHLEAGAAMAGIIKLALALRHGAIPPNLHFKTPNPAIDFEKLKLRIPVSLEEIGSARNGAEPRLAGINSFGFGGSNAHAILQAMPRAPRRLPTRRREPERAELLALSSRSPDGLRATAERYADFLASDEARGSALDEICFTAAAHRSHREERLAAVGTTREDLAERLRAFAAGGSPAGIVTDRPLLEADRGIVFVFSGQGPQWWGMGRECLRDEPVFRRKMEECAALLGGMASWSLLEELARGEATSRLAETAIAQPAIFALQVSLAALWESWGVRPAAAVGHSVGEIAAAHVAGALSLRDAAHVIFQRGRCMDLASERGRMLAAELSAEEAAEAIGVHADRVAIGAVNGPRSVTLSGDGTALETIARALEAREVFCRVLQVNYAFHSQQMDPIGGELLRSLGSFPLSPTTIPLLSTVTGREISGEALDADYWWKNVRQTVRFAPAIDALVARGSRVFLELAAHPVLAKPVSECLRHRSVKGAVVATLRRQEPERAALLGALGRLHALGVPLDWRGVYPSSGPSAGERVRLPSYAWQKERFWHESARGRERRLEPILHPFLSRDLKAALPTFETWLDREAMPYLKDHRVQGHVVFPAAGYLEVVLEAAGQRFGPPPWTLEDVDFLRALLLPEGDETPMLQLVLDPADSSFTLAAANPGDGGEFTSHSAGKVRRGASASPAALRLEEARARCGEPVAIVEFYRRFRAAGLDFGPAFQAVEQIARRDGEALGRIQAPERIHAELAKYRVHPALLDACFQVFSATLPAETQGGATLYLPVHVDRVRFFAAPGPAVWSHARLVEKAGNTIAGDIRMLDDRGETLIAIDGFRCQAVSSGRARAEDPETWIYESRWIEKPLAPAEGTAAPFRPADFMPPSAEVAGAARDVLADRQGAKSLRARFLAVEPAIDELCRGYVLRALGALGWRPSVRESLTTESLARKLRVAARHRRALGRFLGFLAEDEILTRSGDGWRVAKLPPEIDCDSLWQRVLGRLPALHPELTLLHRAGRALPSMLRGKVDALGVIAPGGSLAALEHLYQDAPSAADYNRAIAAAVARVVAALPEGRTLRVLEIGAGTGGMTAYILPKLPRDRAEYVFTDLSPAFFSRAEQKFFDHPVLRCQLLDIEKPPADQGFEPGSFDLVLASDALHATADLREALGYVRELLAPQGLLTMLEIDRPTRWVDLVFGLTPGWWRFRDRDLRPDYALLDRERWRRVLEEAGFESVALVSDVRGPRRSGQTIVVGRAPRREMPAPSPSPKRATGEAAATWLVFADRSSVGERLAADLAAEGERVAIVRAGGDYRALGAGRFEIAPGSKEDVVRLFEEIGFSPTSVAHLWSLDAASADATTVESLLEAEALGCHSVLHLVQTLAAQPRQLWLVTRGSQSAPSAGDDVSPAQGPLWALGRVIQNEHRRLRLRMVDLDPRSDTARAAADLKDELRADDGEEEVALRGGQRYANRLSRAALSRYEPPAPNARHRLEAPAPGALERLELRGYPRRKPGPTEVELEVRAAGLNFRDVMKALGIYPIVGDEDLMLGDECAGRIVAVGRDVRGLRVGDDVVAMTSGCFTSHLTIDSRWIAPMPPGLSYEETSTIPVTFLTAWYALHHLGKMKRDERVLIQAGTGGVGLSALQVARLGGAEIYATAGSAEKRDLLRALGVEHVMDSRSLAFADEIMEKTGGRGVDLVLNSLAGEAIAKGLASLAPGGRFLEIGKRDIYQNTRVGLRPFKSGIALFAIDLQQVMRDRPEFTRSMMAEILALFAARRLRPLPHRIFPIADIAGAFRLLAKAQHVGKLVVSMEGDPIRPTPSPDMRRPRLSADATYLVTGGLGGFGLALAEWMVEAGARTLVLAGRSGAATPQARSAVAKLRRRGARIVVAKSDVADEAAVARLFRRIARTLPPLRGIVHAAMVLDDGLLAELDATRFRRVMAPKVLGAWNLHTGSRGLVLDFFALFSSLSSIVGAPAQGNYVAANGFLDALAHHRRALGLPALTINWGGLAEVGYVARHERVEEHLTRQGILGIPPARALELFGRMLASRATQLGVVRVDWQRWASFVPSVATAPRYGELFEKAAAQSARNGRGPRAAVLEAPPDERLALVTAHLREQVGRVLRTAAAKLDVTRPLGELGVDSLMGFELVNRIETEWSLALPPSKVDGGATIERIAAVLLEVLSAGANGAAHSAAECLLALRAEGSRPPLFCVHPAGGLANVYRPLAERLPSDLPIYALQSRAVASGASEHAEHAEHATIAALAEDYGAAIARRQPHGPYHLLGFSLGGVFALAIARALEARGERVAFLGVIDADLRLANPDVRTDFYVERHITDMYATLSRELAIVKPLDAATLAEEAADLSSRLGAVAASERARAIVEWLGERQHLLAGLSTSMIERYFSLFEAHAALVGGFVPAVVVAPVVLWQGSDGADEAADRAAPWRRATAGRFEQVVLAGSHYELMYPPRVEALAIAVERALKREAGARDGGEGADRRGSREAGASQNA